MSGKDIIFKSLVVAYYIDMNYLILRIHGFLTFKFKSTRVGLN